LIVGAGFSGAVLARELAAGSDAAIRVLDKRNHPAGNCHTARDRETGVMVHEYGPHIFNTNHEDVWSYVNRFGDFRPYVNRVKAVNSRGVFSLPINLHTINQFFGKTFNPAEARAFLATRADATIGEPANFEEQALKFIGRELYEAFFYGYTRKQWGCEPAELPASILKRLPIRFNYNDNYYGSRYQGIPAEGYTAIISRLLDHPRIEVELGTNWTPSMAGGHDHVFYSGPIDEFFGFSEGRLGYRTISFERTRGLGDLQGNAVLNYTDADVPWTRIHEHKHFAPWEEHDRSILLREFSRETGRGDVPYYPRRLGSDLGMLTGYERKAAEVPHTTFFGRLGSYRYLDMDQVIGEALDLARATLAAAASGAEIPRWPVPRGKDIVR
jgi:UDP-galactopyranose mutase